MNSKAIQSLEGLDGSQVVEHDILKVVLDVSKDYL